MTSIPQRVEPMRYPPRREADGPPPLRTGMPIDVQVVKVVFRTQEESGGYTVLAVRFPGHDEETIVTGDTHLAIGKGDRIRISGEWKDHRGERQFKASFMQFAVPEGIAGTLDWLEKGGIKGLGKVWAKRLVERLVERAATSAVRGLESALVSSWEESGRKALDWLGRCSAERGGQWAVSVLGGLSAALHAGLGDVDALIAVGLSVPKAEMVAKTWTMQKGATELMCMLLDVRLKPKQAAAVMDAYGMAAHGIVGKNPWRLMEVEGIGFPTCDVVAHYKHLDMTCPERAEAGTEWVMKERITREGHCGLRWTNWWRPYPGR